MIILFIHMMTGNWINIEHKNIFRVDFGDKKSGS